MTTNVIVRLRFEGLHYWPEADGHVAFLSHPHRHEFHATCKKQVAHADREIEIITLKRSILRFLATFNGNFGRMSCEEIAGDLVTKFGLCYCSVLEDGENGAEVVA